MKLIIVGEQLNFKINDEKDIGEMDFFSAMNFLGSLPIDTSINNKKRTIVVFIDDLDRCWAEKAFELIESLKSIMDLTGYVFVLGMDPRVIGQYLKNKYGPDFTNSYGISVEEYLENTH